MKYTDNIYGAFDIAGVLEELIQTQVFQRLKRIHQGGAIFLIQPNINHTRFEHSIGVLFLIRKLGGRIEEQIAGLLHDISHTAFSHLVDYVLDIEEEDYHEKRFEEVLRDEEVMSVLKRHGFDPNQFLDMEQYPLLEYPLPSLSADRIDYTLRDLFQIGVISQKEIDWFLTGLVVFENRIVLASVEHAQWFQEKYDYLVSDYFGAKQNIAVNLLMKKLIKDCLEKGNITESDFHQDDFYLLEKINRFTNVQLRISAINNQVMTTEKLNTKKRSINPEVLVNNRVIRFLDMDVV